MEVQCQTFFHPNFLISFFVFTHHKLVVDILKKLTYTTNTNFVNSKVKHGVHMYKTFYILVYGLATYVRHHFGDGNQNTARIGTCSIP
jgi:hypothetical protein